MRRFRVSVLLAALALSLLPATTGAAASTSYEQIVDITFPVAGTNSFRDDYDACRGSGCERRHRATDIMTPYGAPVHAAKGGTIRFITGLTSALPSYGYMISIDGDDGRRYSYIHLGRQDGPASEAYATGLQQGSRVVRGQLIGYAGCSGNASCTAPHLHFEIEDVRVTDPYGTNRINPYRSLVDAQARGDLPGRTTTDRFVDVLLRNNHADNILYIADRGVTQGCNPDGDRFCPADSVTRGQMAAFITRALDLPPGPGTGFEDVRKGSIFDDDIDRLAGAGITLGCDDTGRNFCPWDPVTRQQMAAFLVRAFELPAGTGFTFDDVGPGHRFADEIDRLASSGITAGCHDPAGDRFCPRDEVTRAQMASFLARGLQR
jgi:murein DD-endopeptidase MepM/ murein hydrolase activator NlpD